jgi:hypothetical protein
MLLRFKKAALLTPLLALGVVCGSELQVRPALPPQPVGKPAPKTIEKIEKTEGTCGAFGTSVEFAETPQHAATQAKKEQKLVFVLHVSGNFEDPRFT